MAGHQEAFRETYSMMNGLKRRHELWQKARTRANTRTKHVTRGSDDGNPVFVRGGRRYIAQRRCQPDVDLRAIDSYLSYRKHHPIAAVLSRSYVRATDKEATGRSENSKRHLYAPRSFATAAKTRLSTWHGDWIWDLPHRSP